LLNAVAITDKISSKGQINVSMIPNLISSLHDQYLKSWSSAEAFLNWLRLCKKTMQKTILLSITFEPMKPYVLYTLFL